MLTWSNGLEQRFWNFESLNLKIAESIDLKKYLSPTPTRVLI
jgi:hypothetical protein